MKICAISFHSCPYSLLGGEDTGGMSVYLRELSSALTQFPDVKMDIFTRIQYPELAAVKRISSRVRVIHLKAGPKRPIERSRLYDFIPEFANNLKELILQEKDGYEFIFSHYWLSGLAGGWIKYKFDLPLVHTYHTLGFLKKKVLVQNEHNNRLNTERCLAYASDQIISSTFEEKKSLISEYNISPSRVKVIYPGVNSTLFYPFLNKDVYSETVCKEDDLILLYVGRIEPVKGLMTVIEAFDLIKAKNRLLYDRLKLIVIGGGRINIDFPKNREVMRIMKAIKEKKLKDKIIFLGSKEQNELKKYYSAADALIVPSLYESFGLVVVEALSCGTPVLVTQIGKLKTIVKEKKNGFSFRPNDTDSLSRCLEHFCSHKDSLWGREKIRADVIQKFSWEKTAEETYQVLHDLRIGCVSSTTRFQPGEIPLPA